MRDRDLFVLPETNVFEIEVKDDAVEALHQVKEALIDLEGREIPSRRVKPALRTARELLEKIVDCNTSAIRWRPGLPEKDGEYLFVLRCGTCSEPYVWMAWYYALQKMTKARPECDLCDRALHIESYAEPHQITRGL